MAKTIFEDMGDTYTEINGYLIPNLALSTEKEKSIGIWGQRHKRNLREYKKVTYATLLTSGKLNSYLTDIDMQAQERFERLIEQMKAAGRNLCCLFA